MNTETKFGELQEELRKHKGMAFRGYDKIKLVMTGRKYQIPEVNVNESS